jgi:dCTP deaminase
MKPDAILDDERIVITPILEKNQIGSIEVNLRLGRQFLVFKSHLQKSLGLTTMSSYEIQINKFQEEVVIGYQDEIVLHPGELLIGSTLEYVALPRDIEAQVEGRSSWARLGLIIATATTIHPLYKGVITLELSNNGTIPIELQPTVEIAQIIFHKVSPPTHSGESSRYSCAIGPGFSRIYKDRSLFE